MYTAIMPDELARAGCRYLGTPYGTMDCQAFVEKCLADIGIRKDLAGSNAWYRYVMSHGWTGTPEECRKQFGMIPPGAFLFILEQDGNEPSKYYGDGIGNASHIGIYTGLSGKEMAQISGVAGADRYVFGDGAIHSSSSRGCVCTSKFSGKSISGGWNRVGLWDIIFNGGDQHMEMDPYQAKVIDGRLNLRTQPSTSSERLTQIPNGSVITVTDERGDWRRTSWDGCDGWVMGQYLERIEEEDPDTVRVPLEELRAVYDTIGDWLGLRG